MKVIQDALGHKDISTTLNIYTDVTKELKRLHHLHQIIHILDVKVIHIMT